MINRILLLVLLSLAPVTTSAQQIEWTPVSTGLDVFLRGVTFLDRNTAFVVGMEGYLLKSTDAGLTWNRIPVPVDNHLWTIAAINETTLLISADAGVVLRSIDRGETWSVLETPLKASDIMWSSQVLDPSTIILSGKRGGIASGSTMRSTDAGITWKIMGDVPATAQFGRAAFINEDIGHAAVVKMDYSGAIYRTMDGGVNWSEVHPTNSSLNGLDVNVGRWLAVGNSGAIQLSTNGGQSWSEQVSGTNEELFSVKFIDNMHALVMGSKIYESTNGGGEWHATNAPQNENHYYDVAKSSNGVLLAVGAWGTILRSTSVLGVETDAVKTSSIHPNPSESIVQIGLHKGGELVDVAGKVVVSIEEETTELSIGHLPSGVYFLRLVNRDGTLKVEKLVRK